MGWIRVRVGVGAGGGGRKACIMDHESPLGPWDDDDDDDNDDDNDDDDDDGTYSPSWFKNTSESLPTPRDP